MSIRHCGKSWFEISKVVISKKHRGGEWFDLNLDDIEGIRKNYQSLDPAFLTTE